MSALTRNGKRIHTKVAILASTDFVIYFEMIRLSSSIFAGAFVGKNTDWRYDRTTEFVSDAILQGYIQAGKFVFFFSKYGYQSAVRSNIHV